MLLLNLKRIFKEKGLQGFLKRRKTWTVHTNNSGQTSLLQWIHGKSIIERMQVGKFLMMHHTLTFIAASSSLWEWSRCDFTSSAITNSADRKKWLCSFTQLSSAWKYTFIWSGWTCCWPPLMYCRPVLVAITKSWRGLGRDVDGHKNDFPVRTGVWFQDLKTTTDLARDAAWAATDLAVNVGCMLADIVWIIIKCGAQGQDCVC